MALKSINFKQIFLEKGERIALFAGVGVMGLMVAGFGIGTVLSDGPDNRVNALQKAKLEAQSAMNSSRPPDDLKKLPDDLNVVDLKPLDSELYAAKIALFQSLTAEDRKWRQPVVLGPDEFQVNLIRGNVLIFILGQNAKKEMTIGVLSEKTTKPLTQEELQKRARYLQDVPGLIAKYRSKQSTKRRPAPQVVQGLQPPTSVGAERGVPGGNVPGAVTSASSPEMRGRIAPLPGMGAPGATTATPEQELKMVPFDKAPEEKGTFAERTQPLRMVEITATFPYKAQLEEFRKALRLTSVDDVFALEETTPKFTGFNVQRRAIRLSGSNRQPTEWADLDWETAVRNLMFQINPENREADDPLLEQYGMIVPGLALARPKLGHGSYPEAKLEKLEQAKQAMENAYKAAGGADALKPKGRRPADVDIFNTGAGTSNKPGMNDAERLAPPPAGVRTIGTPPRPGRVSMSPEQRVTSEGTLVNKPQVYPDEVLVRFLDVDVQPGFAYEYRIQIKMANPTFGQKEKAVSDRITKEKEIEGQWTPVKWQREGHEVTQIPVGNELQYYVKDPEEKAPEGSKPAPKTTKDRAVVQVHKWLWAIQTKPGQKLNQLDVGDWSVLDNRVVHRGEYVGRWQEVEIPVWLTTQARFGFAIHPDEQVKLRGKNAGFRYKQFKGVPVDFATDSNTGDRDLVVDFEGGERTFTVDGKNVKTTGPVDMLVLNADGRLVMHNSHQDMNNPKRDERFKAWENWIQTVKNGAEEAGTGGKQDNLFQKPKGGPG